MSATAGESVSGAGSAWRGIQLSRVHSIPIVPFVGRGWSMIAVCWLWCQRQSGGHGRGVPCARQGVIFLFLIAAPSTGPGGGVRLVFQVNHHGAVLWQESCVKAVFGHPG